MIDNDNITNRKQLIIIGVLIFVVVLVVVLYLSFGSRRDSSKTGEIGNNSYLSPTQVAFLLQKKLKITPLPKPTLSYGLDGFTETTENNISNQPKPSVNKDPNLPNPTLQPTTSPERSTGVRESDIETLTDPSSEQVKATNQEKELKSLAPFKTKNYKLEFDYATDKFVVTLNKPEDIGYRELQDMLREYFPNIPLDKFKYIFKNSIVDYNAIGKKDNKPTSNPIEEYRSGQVSTLNEIIANIAKINEKYADGTVVVADTPTPTPTSSVSPTSLPGPTVSVDQNIPQGQNTNGFVSFKQCNYASTPLLGGCNMCKVGCGITSAAMAIRSLTNDPSVNPVSVLGEYNQNYYKRNPDNKNGFNVFDPFYNGCGGSSIMGAKPIIEQHGLQTSSYLFSSKTGLRIDEIASEIRPYIEKGWIIFAVTRFCENGCGHFIVLTAIDSNNIVDSYDVYYEPGSSVQPIHYQNRSPFPKYISAFAVRNPL